MFSYTVEQKDKLISQIKGVSYEAIQELFSVNAIDLPCVYLTAFNTVGRLRNTMSIDVKYPDDAIVYKFGLTKSMSIRKNGHKSEYKELDIDMKLALFTYIDPLYVSDAETEIKNVLEDFNLCYKEHKELVVISPNQMKFVKSLYENIGYKYSGHTATFNKQIAELNTIISDLNHQNEKLKYGYENAVKMFEKEKEIYEHKLANKDQQIRILELEKMLLQKN